MSLLAAATNPKLFKAIAAFVPITDLAAWYYEGHYCETLEACLGGEPD